jgi:hypothetical protein
LKPTASRKNWKRHHEVASFLHDGEFTCVTEDNVKETLTKMTLFPSKYSDSNKANNLTILCPAAPARCSLQSVPADSLMPTSFTRNPSVKFKTIMVLSITSGLGSSISLKALFF